VSHAFQAEVQQLLDIVINSLYTDREIFVRELVSNASDALEKVRHLQLQNTANLNDPELALEIAITTDEEAKTITISDTGVGLNREELIANLGTIAHSGTKAFMQALKDSNGSTPGSLIGKFGVGFYSVFMVADKVTVYTRSAQGTETLAWTSDGRSGYDIADAPEQSRGSRIVIELKEDAAEFAQTYTIKGILEKYSNFVPFPITLNGERINKIDALWLKNKNEVTEAQYKEFYQFTGRAWDEPRFTVHFAADAPLQINALVFIPTENPEKMGFGTTEHGVSLYCRRVLIDRHPPDFLPEWLRFLRGVVDSEDLPLNISRESMQDSALVKKLGEVVVGKVIKHLEDQGTAEPEKYKEFYASFNRYIKEGCANDYRNQAKLPKLLRFESSLQPKGELVSLNDYLTRKKEGQEAIYFQIGPNREAIENGPYLEAFTARGLEVLFCYDPLDDYVMTSVREFEGLKLSAVDREDVKLNDLNQDEAGALSAAEIESLGSWMKDTLGNGVSAVNKGQRLVDSPAAAIVPENAPSAQMRAMMRAMGQEAPATEVKLEINPRHPLIKGLSTLREKDPELSKMVAAQLLDNALLSAGLLDDSRSMIQRISQIMERTVARE
jgi:TNF receptor-associated protein 1